MTNRSAGLTGGSGLEAWRERVRADFPARGDWTYLQSAGTGLPAPGAAEAAGGYYRDVAAAGCEAQPQWQRRERSARERLERLMGVPSDEIGFFRNTSEVINLAANSIVWQSGDEVIVFADEYPCNVLPWEAAQRNGVTLVRLEPDPPGQREEQLLAAMTPRTRVVSVSHVHPWTGTRLDLTRIGRACREVDALFIVDGIQALGATPVDLTYVDVYGAGVFKWLLSGFGTAVGVVRERARAQLVPVFRSYRNPPPSQTLDYAAPNFPGLYVLDATLEYLEALGWGQIFAEVEHLTNEVFRGLERVGVTPLTPRERRAGIVSIELPESAQLVRRLRAQGVSVSDKEGHVLVSPHFYNTDADIARFVEVLEVIRER